ncbi:MAG TPA: hypothetical protein VK656_07280 [Candidatus Acidoferrum sp.]|nr:hypothetical protein [Candidatus Acidoferrum sp.]
MPLEQMLLRVLAFVVGVILVGRAIASAVRVFVLPRASNEPIARFVFTMMSRLFRMIAKPSKPYAFRDRVMAYYAPVSLLVLPIVWLAIVLVGYTAIFWSFGADKLSEAFRISGSSLFTLGFAPTAGTAEDIAAFSEAGIGLLLLALLIAYLPTMYASFSRRELAVNLLEVRADTPPSAIAMMQRFHRLGQMDHFHGQLELWETWFADIAESHTSLAALAFFRSPQRDHSWVNAAGAIMDGAALYRSTIDVPRDIQADLTIRAGYLALRRIADFFGLPYEHEPNADTPCSISQEEYGIACDELADKGIALKPDREQAWRDFRGWRINYDQTLLALARLTMAPPARWNGRPWEVIEPLHPARTRPFGQ